MKPDTKALRKLLSAVEAFVGGTVPLVDLVEAFGAWRAIAPAPMDRKLGPRRPNKSRGVPRNTALHRCGACGELGHERRWRYCPAKGSAS